MRIIAHADVGGRTKYLVTEADGQPNEMMTVQMIVPGYLVTGPMLIGSLTAHDPYTDWKLVSDPPPLAEILGGIITWPLDAEYLSLGRPFLTQEVGERIVAEAAASVAG